MKIIWTKHSEQRFKEWQGKLNLTRLEIENIIDKPHQIVPGDLDVLVAQYKLNNGLLRIPFKYADKNTIVILTIYWTSKIDKYWRKENES